VARKDVADGAAVQRIVEWQDGPAGNARDGADALPFEQDAQEVGSGDFHGGFRVGARSVAANQGAKKSPSGAEPEGESVSGA